MLFKGLIIIWSVAFISLNAYANDGNVSENTTEKKVMLQSAKASSSTNSSYDMTIATVDNLLAATDNPNVLVDLLNTNSKEDIDDLLKAATVLSSTTSSTISAVATMGPAGLVMLPISLVLNVIDVYGEKPPSKEDMIYDAVKRVEKKVAYIEESVNQSNIRLIDIKSILKEMEIREELRAKWRDLTNSFNSNIAPSLIQYKQYLKSIQAAQITAQKEGSNARDLMQESLNAKNFEKYIYENEIPLAAADFYLSLSPSLDPQASENNFLSMYLQFKHFLEDDEFSSGKFTTSLAKYYIEKNLQEYREKISNLKDDSHLNYNFAATPMAMENLQEDIFNDYVNFYKKLTQLLIDTYAMHKDWLNIKLLIETNGVITSDRGLKAPNFVFCFDVKKQKSYCMDFTKESNSSIIESRKKYIDERYHHYKKMQKEYISKKMIFDSDYAYNNMIRLVIKEFIRGLEPIKRLHNNHFYYAKNGIYSDKAEKISSIANEMITSWLGLKSGMVVQIDSGFKPKGFDIEEFVDSNITIDGTEIRLAKELFPKEFIDPNVRMVGGRTQYPDIAIGNQEIATLPGKKEPEKVSFVDLNSGYKEIKGYPVLLYIKPLEKEHYDKEITIDFTKSDLIRNTIGVKNKTVVLDKSDFDTSLTSSIVFNQADYFGMYYKACAEIQYDVTTRQVDRYDNAIGPHFYKDKNDFTIAKFKLNDKELELYSNQHKDKLTKLNKGKDLTNTNYFRNGERYPLEARLYRKYLVNKDGSKYIFTGEETKGFKNPENEYERNSCLVARIINDHNIDIELFGKNYYSFDASWHYPFNHIQYSRFNLPNYKNRKSINYKDIYKYTRPINKTLIETSWIDSEQSRSSYDWSEGKVSLSYIEEGSYKKVRDTILERDKGVDFYSEKTYMYATIKVTDAFQNIDYDLVDETKYQERDLVGKIILNEMTFEEAEVYCQKVGGALPRGYKFITTPGIKEKLTKDKFYWYDDSETLKSRKKQSINKIRKIVSIKENGESEHNHPNKKSASVICVR